MDVPRGFDGFALVPPPDAGLWRVSAWRDPFDPPAPPPPIGCASEEDDGHRFDDPRGVYRTLYCATDPEGALGESLGDFLFNAAAARRIESFLDDEPDGTVDEDYQRVLTADDLEGFGWRLAHAPTHPEARCIDVNDWRTYVAAGPRLLGVATRYGLRHIDRGTLLDERRNVTRALAGVWREEATDAASGELRAAGLRFESRLPPAWECWALWEPLPLDIQAATVEDVTINTPPLRLAADMLGIPLAAA